jgi:DNA-binding NarL/FixJ family response regulator
MSEDTKPGSIGSAAARIGAGRTTAADAELVHAESARGGLAGASAVCRALEQPLTVLSGLIEAASDHAQPSEDLRALLERVARQAAEVHELVQGALAVGVANAAPTAPVSTLSAAPVLVPAPTRYSDSPPGQMILRSLTERESQVLALIAKGLASKEIAHRLGITSATVRSHVQNILTKLGVCNRRQAAALLAGRLPSAARARLRSVRRAPQPPRPQVPAAVLAPIAAPTAPPVLAPAATVVAPDGAPVLAPAAAAVLARADAPPERAGLTRREVQVLRCLAAGLGRSEIAERLYVSPHTARTHIQRVLTKLGVHSALGAMAVARAAGLAPASP